MQTEKIKFKGKSYKFNYKDRKHTLDIFLPVGKKSSPTIALNTGQKIMIPEGVALLKLGYSMSFAIRRFLYKRLCELDYENRNDYIVVLDVPNVVTKTTKISFIGLDVQFPNIHGEHFKKNEAFAKEIIDIFHLELNKFIETVALVEN